ncbi:MAG: hypothetical protein JNG90_09545 [Planctomycetaceae bacterium]|nr:hypothetical protein [Planctomycetaceae bacterium]
MFVRSGLRRQRAVVVVWLLAAASAAPLGAAEPPENRHARAALEELVAWVELFRAARTEGPALRPLLPRETLLSVSSHLSPEAAALYVDRLSDPRTLTRLGIDRPTVNQLIEGLELVTPLLAEIEPQIQVVAARQTFAGMQAVPAAKLPAVAMVFRPRDPSRAKRLLMSAYLLAMQGANDTAREAGRPRLTMESKRRGDGFYAASMFRLPRNPPPEIVGLADYNLSPSIAVIGERMILSSSRELAIELVDLASADEGALLVPESLRVDWGPAATVQLAASNLPALTEALIDGRQCEFVDEAFARLHGACERGLERLPRWTVGVKFDEGWPWLVTRHGL